VNYIFVDDEAAGETIQRMLNLPETTVTAYADPLKGLADALTKPLNFVLLDMRMPGMSGEEVFARLTKNIPACPSFFSLRSDRSRVPCWPCVTAHSITYRNRLSGKIFC